jgi:hypothetical protein
LGYTFKEIIMAYGNSGGHAKLGVGKKGKQDVTKMSCTEYAEKLFRATATPKSVKAYMGKGARIKHDEN